MSAAQQLVIGNLLARDWLALVAVDAFVDTAKGGGKGGGATIKSTSTVPTAPLRGSREEKWPEAADF